MLSDCIQPGAHRLIYNSDSLSRLPSRAPETLQDRRDAIRDTWGRNVRENAHVVLHFFAYQHDQGGTGLLLEREAEQQKDLSIIRDEYLSDTPLEYGVEVLTQKVHLMLCIVCRSLQAAKRHLHCPGESCAHVQ